MATFLMMLFPVVALLSPKQTPVFLVLVSIVVAVMAMKQRPVFSFATTGPLIGALAVFVLYLMLSGLWSDAPLNGLREGAKLVAFVGMASILFSTVSPNREFAPGTFSSWVRDLTPVIFIAVALAALIIRAVNGDQPFLVGTGLAKFQVDKFNEFHAIMAVFFYPILLAVHFGKSRYKPLLFGAFIIIVGADAMWASPLETVKLALAVSLASFLLVLVSPTLGRFVSVAMMCALSVLPFFLVQLPTWAFAELPYSLLHRIAIWDFVFAHIGDHLWFGIGLDGARSIAGGSQVIDVGTGIASTFPEAVRENFVLFKAQYLPLHTHNTVIQILLEGGLAGLTFYLVFAATLIGTIFKYCTQRFDLACAISFMVMIVTINSASFGAWQSWWWATLLLGVLSFRSARRCNSTLTTVSD